MKVKTIKPYIIEVVLACLFLVMHVYRIGQLPYGIHCDEMGMGYDAWCLSHFGTDRYQNSFPVYLINFSGGQSALYAYLCAPFVYFFGMDAAVFRIPAVICSAVTCYFIIKITGLLYGRENRRIKLLAWFLYDIFPVFTMLFRIGLDCNLMMGVSTVFLYCLMKAVEGRRAKQFLAAGIAGGLMLYSYVLSHIALPLFFLLAVPYLLYVRKIGIKGLAALGLPVALSAIPLLAMHVVNYFGLPEVALGIFTIPRLYRYRSGDMSFPEIWDNIRRFGRFTLIYDGISHDSIRRFGTMYRITIPFLMAGIASYIREFVRSFRTRACSLKCLALFWAVSIFCVGILMGEGGPIVYRMNAIYAAYLLFTAEGICLACRLAGQYKESAAKILAGVLLAGYSLCFALFAKYYFMDYTRDTYLLDYFDFKLNEPFAWLAQQPPSVSGRTTYIGNMSFTYIYFLGSTELAPREYNELVDDKPYTLYLWMTGFDKYRFEIPEKVDPAANYIVPETDLKSIQLLDGYGLDRTLAGKHYVYTNPWLDYRGENSDCVISWDHGLDENGVMILDEGGKTVLSGWAWNRQYGRVWDDILVEAGGVYYAAEKMARKDVADLMGDASFSDSGFHVTMDAETVRAAGHVRVICIDYGNGACFVQEIPVGR